MSSDPLSLHAYDYDLPPERIAQSPAERREDARLLVLDRRSGAMLLRRFSDLGDHLNPGDLLVLNDARVFPARFRFRRAGGGDGEMLLLEPAGTEEWEALLRPAQWARKRLRKRFEITPPGGEGGFGVEILEDRREGRFRVRLLRSGSPLGFEEAIALCQESGEVPLPPYIRRQAEDPLRPLDRERYQTVYARAPVAVAAPTAGLHFTPQILDGLRARGVEVAAITQQVGIGTFLPLRQTDLRSITLHEEETRIDAAAAGAILAARSAGRRIVACGTTSVRALESFALAGMPVPHRARTDLFIKPGHRFELVGALITNFHLPRSSLLVLVSAFAGRERILEAYALAIREGCRFYSYGDAMLIL